MEGRKKEAYYQDEERHRSIKVFDIEAEALAYARDLVSRVEEKYSDMTFPSYTESCSKIIIGIKNLCRNTAEVLIILV
ncbi:MAG TPA: hypothetical protein VIG80_06765 [Bacillaceae bacterium]